MKAPALGQVVEVEWEDAIVDGPWQLRSGIDRTRVRCRSVGMLLRSDGRGMVLAGALGRSEAACVQIIPRRQVVRVRRLRRGK